MWIITLIDYHTLLGHVFSLYGVSVLTLIATFILGMTVFGSRRWIGSRGLHLQVSEFVKVVLILLVARYLTELKTEQLELRDLLKLGGLVGLPMVLVIKQPDLGTALTYLPILLSGIYLAGLRWQYAAAIVLVFVLVLPVGYYFLQDYQKARLVSFIDPSQDPKGTGYQVIQSKIAVGSGALVGQGCHAGADAVAVPAGPAYGFHLLGFRRGAWIRRSCCSIRVVFSVAHADRAERADCARPGRNPDLHGGSNSVVVPHSGERWNGGGPDAGDRHPAAADEFRRLEYSVGIFDAGAW